MLRALGAPAQSEVDLPDAIRARRLEAWERLLPPCLVARTGGPVAIPVRFSAETSGRLSWHLHLENAAPLRGTARVEELAPMRGADVEGRARIARRLPLAADLPAGYHRLEVRVGLRSASATLLCAPETVYGAERTRPCFGLFHPLYALRDARRWGVGDFGTLRAALEWAAESGADAFATLPLFPAFPGETDPGGPYRPISRRFWNEVYIEVERVPGAGIPRIRAALDIARASAASADAAALVDWKTAGAVKRAALDAVADAFFRAGGDRDPSFLAFLARRPLASEYARFCAAAEQWERAPGAWPERARRGVLPEGMVPGHRVRRHLYAQWVAEMQLDGLAADAPGRPGLYLDLPLGIHPDGFDAWREQGLFARDASTGAPPDPFAARGQDWGMPPLVPDASRRTGHRYYAECMRTAMRFARWIRIDHVMSLHRLYWIPPGLPPTEGVYVRYPAEELAAVLAIESHRAGCEVAGEDLGTVAPELRRLMERRGMRRSYVLAFGFPERLGEDPDPVPPGSVATIETHDMYPFAALLDGGDVRDRVALGLLPEARAPTELEERARRVRALLAALPGPDDDPVAAALTWLGRSAARLVLAPVDDLVSSREPHNVPGTTGERPNWRRRLDARLDELRADERVSRRVAALRRVRVERAERSS